jgi:chlorite dismutase/nitrite reductase/ring-hydroxylating ferredoxin subunit
MAQQGGKKKEARQLVRYLFLKVRPEWRRLDPTRQAKQKEAFGLALKGFHGRLLLRAYSLMGTRGDADLMLWQVAENLETLQAVETAMFSTELGGYLEIPYSYLGMTKRSEYEFPDLPGEEDRTTVSPSDAKYLFVYPFIKKREWYSLPFEQRQQAMNDHVRIGRSYPDIRINTTYSFGLDDQEFVVAFEGSDPGDFLDLVMELRSSPASAYTEQDIPVFTCVQMSLWDALDSLGGASAEARSETVTRDADGYTPVASVDEVRPGQSKRVYLDTDAVAVFNVQGTYYAVSDRCTHGRASLSEGKVDRGTCVLECPWHGGRFDLKTGVPTAGPPTVPVKTFEIKVAGDRILVR